MRIAQLTDTHVVADGALCHGLDTGAYLAAAIAHLNDLRLDHVLVTGDLTDHGRPEEYDAFVRVMTSLTVPWSVVPGNHDDAVALRSALPLESTGGERGTVDGRVAYARDLGDVRIVGLDVNVPHASPGAQLLPPFEDWLDRTLAGSSKPTLLAVHQPPFSAGLWYLDVFGFKGATRLRAVVDRHPHVGRVVCGHIHCVRSARWRHALALSGPSSAPQFVPLFHRLDVLMQEPGFVLHEHTAAGWTSVVHRRGPGGFVETERY